jgi:hypothetical protein
LNARELTMLGLRSIAMLRWLPFLDTRGSGKFVTPWPRMQSEYLTVMATAADAPGPPEVDRFWEPPQAATPTAAAAVRRTTDASVAVWRCAGVLVLKAWRSICCVIANTPSG